MKMLKIAQFIELEKRNQQLKIIFNELDFNEGPKTFFDERIQLNLMLE